MLTFKTFVVCSVKGANLKEYPKNVYWHYYLTKSEPRIAYKRYMLITSSGRLLQSRDSVKRRTNLIVHLAYLYQH